MADKMFTLNVVDRDGNVVDSCQLPISDDSLQGTNDVWCRCDLSVEEMIKQGTIYKSDGACDCGIIKHHYHCPLCGKVEQIG